MKVLVSGGGTAGHIYPALTVAAQLANARDEVVFIGTPDGLEAQLVPASGVDFVAVPAAGFDRARPWTLITSSLRILMSVVRVWSILGRMRPDAVVGFGGYVSIPVGVAALLRGTPLVLHEQNSVPGMANRFLSRWATATGVTYPESIDAMARPERAVVTGNPVRQPVLESTRAQGRELLGLGDDETVVLVFGGSRGARHINDAIVGLRDRTAPLQGVRVVLVTGRAEYESVCERLGAEGDPAIAGHYIVLDYFEQMGAAIAAADVVVARAGATSIAELTVLGAPCILVPYPYATDDHQTKNAATMVAHGAAILVPDGELDSSRFGDELIALIGDPARRASMSAASHALGVADAAARLERIVRSSAVRQASDS